MSQSENRPLVVRLPPDLKRATALIAASRGIRISQVVREALAPVVAGFSIPEIGSLPGVAAPTDRIR